jgi:aerobic-type carbon monoxide dehydrogenase small subunit (CoxS/CutS family)
MTGSKFGCGAAQCLSCAVIIDNPDGTSYTSPTCIVPAVSFNGKSIRTVEGLAKNGELSILQKAFIEHFAFQCGYCTAGFLNESQVLLERLAKKPIARADLEKTIAEALDGHLCRCTPTQHIALGLSTMLVIVALMVAYGGVWKLRPRMVAWYG